ncbi:DMT family transporter [Actinomadura alba]|uniref:DMT family transporter n=1 Tax=Actinomadura alba TaxID=406431 RepID=UPI0028AD95FE|nr:EamA family transporter [Actinomadura alba]
MSPSTRLSAHRGSEPRRARSARLGGSGCILLAAALWGTTGTVRTFAPDDAGAVSVGAARIVLGGLLLLAIGARGGALVRLLRTATPATWALLALGAVCAAGYQTAFFAAVDHTGVATGTVVTIGSAPAFTGLLSRLTGGARLSRRWVASTAGAVVGCAALVSGGEAAGIEPLGVALALLSGFAYAAYATTAARLITSGEGDGVVMGAIFGGAGVLLLPVLLASSPVWVATGRGVLVTLYLGVVTTTLGYVLYGRGLRSTPVATAATLTLAEPAVAAVLGLVVLGERLGGVAVGGLLLLAASLVLLAVPSRK